MSVIRLIHITLAPDDLARAEQVWKAECAPLMIQQPGWISEKLMKCRDAVGEFISYSEWDSVDDVERYRDSPAHAELVAHARDLQGARAVVKLYDPVT